MTTGYSGKPLATKLGLKPGALVLLVGAPAHYPTLLGAIYDQITLVQAPTSTVDFIHLFAENRQDLESHFLNLKSRLSKQGSFWVSWPKAAAKTQTDLNDNVVREFGLANGLVDVKVCAVDEKWSAIKFVYRLGDRT